MKKVIDYTVAYATDMSILELCVKRFIKEGWQPVGGISFTKEGDYYTQAMVKYEEEVKVKYFGTCLYAAL